jgi:hypothetical protein
LRIGKEELQRRVKIEFMQVSDKYSNSGEYRFISNLVVGVQMAARILREMDMLYLDIDRIMDVMGIKFNEIIASKRRADTDTREDVLGDFINKNVQNVLVLRDNKTTLTPRGPLYVRAEVDNGLIFISTSAMKQYLLDIRLGVKDFENRLTTAGMLKGKIRKQMAAGWNDAIGSTNVQAYVIATEVASLFPKLKEKVEVVDEKAERASTD